MTVSSAGKDNCRGDGPCVEVADIFRRYGDQYREQHNLTTKQHQAMFDIEHCRTGYFGYHVDACDSCGHIDRPHNSCRNRHCPKCQGISRRKWVNARVENLLPVPYYHATFTLPNMINPLVPFNKELFYELIFDSSSQTLLQFGQDPRWLGGLIGFYGILHSWGGKMWHHLHTHYILPAGGIDDQGHWIEPSHQGRFMFPVCAVSVVFRGKFIQGLKRAYYQGNLVLPDGYTHLADPKQFERYIDAVVARDWNVNIKRPFADPERVVRYIGRYTHKIAISNNRIIKVENDRVHFKYKNYRNEGRWEETSLNATDFIDRFLMHVLPHGFHKIRHYGFLANGRCKTMVQKIRDQLGQTAPADSATPEALGHKCPKCGQGIMRALFTFTHLHTLVHAGYRIMQCEALLDSS